MPPATLSGAQGTTLALLWRVTAPQHDALAFSSPVKQQPSHRGQQVLRAPGAKQQHLLVPLALPEAVLTGNPECCCCSFACCCPCCSQCGWLAG
jgi:hypothetical protein